MASPAQIDLWHAEKVATQVTVQQASNGIHYAVWGENRISETDLERLVGAVPSTMSGAIESRAYYFVPLAIADTGDIMVAPAYSVELGDRAICHRNAAFGSTEAVFISTRLVEDRFGLAFEFFINVAHNFVEAAGVPERHPAPSPGPAPAGRRRGSAPCAPDGGGAIGRSSCWGSLLLVLRAFQPQLGRLHHARARERHLMPIPIAC